MPGIAAYLHGVEFISDPNTVQVATVRRSAVVGLVGTAPIQLVDGEVRPAVNEITLINSQGAGTQLFGPEVPGYTIPSAIRAIALQGAPFILVVNVFDPDNVNHYKSVVSESRTFDDSNRLVAGQQGIYEVVVTNVGGSTTYTLNDDYAYDGGSGQFVRVATGAIDPGESVEISYKYGVPLGDRTQVTDEAITFDVDAKVVANTPPIQDVVVTSADGLTFYVEGKDYTLTEETGTISRLSGGDIAASGSVLVDYTYGDPMGVRDSEIVGGEADGSNRSGIWEFKSGFPKYSFNPRILIAPGYSTRRSIQTVLESISEQVLGHCGIDAPIGTTRDAAISGRNGIGAARNFISTSYRQVNLWPHVISAATEELEAYSPYWAGVFSRTQSNKGFWWSPSNQGIYGISGTEYPVSASHTDSTADVQLVNAVGIKTIYGATSLSSFATAYKTWGNRSAAYPSLTDPKQFIAVQVVEDQIRLALEIALLPYIDRPINQVTIQLIIQTMNAFLRRLIATGALVDARTLFLASDNDVSDIANGELTVRLEYASPPPLERLVVRARYNRDFLVQLGARTLGEAAVGIASL